MKKCLFALLIIHILSLIYGFFAILSYNVLYAIILAVLGILELIPIIAIINCLESTEQNTADISYIYTKLKSIEKANEEILPSYTTAIKHNDAPNKSWKCIKCDTVNKAEDMVCSGCKTEYSYLNPTFDPEPKRKSRFVKFK